MKLSSLIVLWTVVRGCLAYPGMDGGGVEMIGDLIELADDALTEVGRAVKGILESTVNPEDLSSRYIGVPAKDSQACEDDPCCIWEYIKRDMYDKFHGDSGRCTKHARGAIRLGFHDAASWNKGDSFGGADGSIILGNELTRSEHDGLQDIGITVQGWYDKYHSKYGVSMADLIQMGANIATVTCPLGPRVRSFVGRKDSTRPAPRGRMPDVHAAAEDLVALFANKSFTPAGLVALVGAHSTSQQHYVDDTKDGAPQDSTPGVWDMLFYSETLSDKAPPRVFKFPSDVALSKHYETRQVWNAFASQSAQLAWNTAYAREYVRLSLLSVDNINDLVECTKVLPMPTTVFTPPDQAAMQQWLQGKDTPKKDAGAAVEDGKSLGLSNGVLGVVGELGNAVGSTVGGIIGGIGGIIGGLGGILNKEPPHKA